MKDRVASAERALREAGFDARVSVEGHDESVAAISLPPEQWGVLLGDRRLTAEIKDLGFRYVALDLEPPANG